MTNLLGRFPLPATLAAAAARILSCRARAVLLPALLLPAAAHAQVRPPTSVPCPQCIEVPSWVGQFTILSGNAVLGGLTAGIRQELRGGSFKDGFTRGFLGGAVVYAGKRIAIQNFDGAGFLGREVGAVGASMVRNASENLPLLSRLSLSAGPVRVLVDRREGRREVRPTLDVIALMTTSYAVAEPQLDLDWGKTLSAGAPVFTVQEKLMRGPFDDFETTGQELATTIFLSEIDLFGPEYARRVFAHERVHVIQGDFYSRVWADPLGEWLLEKVPGGERVERFLDIDTGDIMIGLLEIAAFKSYEGRPWELEAEWLARR